MGSDAPGLALSTQLDKLGRRQPELGVALERCGGLSWPYTSPVLALSRNLPEGQSLSEVTVTFGDVRVRGDSHFLK